MYTREYNTHKHTPSLRGENKYTICVHARSTLALRPFGAMHNATYNTRTHTYIILIHSPPTSTYIPYSHTQHSPHTQAPYSYIIPTSRNHNYSYGYSHTHSAQLNSPKSLQQPQHHTVHHPNPQQATLAFTSANASHSPDPRDQVLHVRLHQLPTLRHYRRANPIATTTKPHH